MQFAGNTRTLVGDVAFRAWARGCGASLREMRIKAVEKHVGDIEGIPKTHTLVFISHSGCAHIVAGIRQIALQRVGINIIDYCK